MTNYLVSKRSLLDHCGKALTNIQLYQVNLVTLFKVCLAGSLDQQEINNWTFVGRTV